MKPVFFRGLHSVFNFSAVVQVKKFDRQPMMAGCPPEILDAWKQSDLVLKVFLSNSSKDYLIGDNALVFCKVIGIAYSDIPTD